MGVDADCIWVWTPEDQPPILWCSNDICRRGHPQARTICCLPRDRCGMQTSMAGRCTLCLSRGVDTQALPGEELCQTHTCEKQLAFLQSRPMGADVGAATHYAAPPGLPMVIEGLTDDAQLRNPSMAAACTDQDTQATLSGDMENLTIDEGDY